ncbi:MAG: HD domain-containing protein [Armatimonadetes bacterium]|nr:MAG: HD domain-containing protein [Armatimonadota bacterium]
MFLMLEKAKSHTLQMVKKGDPKFSYLFRHIPEVEKWARDIISLYPQADKEVVLFSVWMHDIGQVVKKDVHDHAVRSEVEVWRYLPGLGLSPEIIGKIAHCVRAHRCSDVQPETLEAKILAVADSASHMTDFAYAAMALDGRLGEARGKLERDYRDISLLSEVRLKTEPLYQAWKLLLDKYNSV